MPRAAAGEVISTGPNRCCAERTSTLDGGTTSPSEMVAKVEHEYVLWWRLASVFPAFEATSINDAALLVRYEFMQAGFLAPEQHQVIDGGCSDEGEEH